MQIKRKERTYQIIIAILTILLVLETVCLLQRRKEDAPIDGNESGNEIVVDAYISEHFEEALQDGSIQVWYQPIIDPKTDESFPVKLFQGGKIRKNTFLLLSLFRNLRRAGRS